MIEPIFILAWYLTNLMFVAVAAAIAMGLAACLRTRRRCERQTGADADSANIAAADESDNGALLQAGRRRAHA